MQVLLESYAAQGLGGDETHEAGDHAAAQGPDDTGQHETQRQQSQGGYQPRGNFHEALRKGVAERLQVSDQLLVEHGIEVACVCAQGIKGERGKGKKFRHCPTAVKPREWIESQRLACRLDGIKGAGHST